MIRRVNIVSANSDSRVYRRQLSTFILRIELRFDPLPYLSSNSTNQTEILSNITASIINRYQCGELDWSNYSAFGNATPSGLSVQEPLSNLTVPLNLIDRLVLVTFPSSCREQSPCEIQPVLIAYDSSGNVINKLGSIDQPWQIIATIVGQSNDSLISPLANYTDGQSQYTSFGLPFMGTYQIQFSFVLPIGVSRYISRRKENFLIKYSLCLVHLSHQMI